MKQLLFTTILILSFFISNAQSTAVFNSTFKDFDKIHDGSYKYSGEMKAQLYNAGMGDIVLKIGISHYQIDGFSYRGKEQRYNHKMRDFGFPIVKNRHQADVSGTVTIRGPGGYYDYLSFGFSEPMVSTGALDLYYFSKAEVNEIVQKWDLKNNIDNLKNLYLELSHIELTNTYIEELAEIAAEVDIYLADQEKKKESNKDKEDDFWNGEDEEVTKTNESDDNFWNGEDKKVVNDKNNNNDFWSGNSAKNMNNDFWTGKGSTEEEVNVQKSIATATGNQYIGQKEVLTKRITISYYDHGEIDGDRINIKHNGKTKANNVTLRSYDENLSLDLEEGVNRISFEALNQGSSGQNTASFTVYDANKNVLYTNEWKINTGFKGTLLLIKL